MNKFERVAQIAVAQLKRIKKCMWLRLYRKMILIFENVGHSLW